MIYTTLMTVKIKTIQPVITPGIYHNPSLGLISFSSDGENWFTIADKNVGATEIVEGIDINDTLYKDKFTNNMRGTLFNDVSEVSVPEGYEILNYNDFWALVGDDSYGFTSSIYAPIGYYGKFPDGTLFVSGGLPLTKIELIDYGRENVETSEGSYVRLQKNEPVQPDTTRIVLYQLN